MSKGEPGKEITRLVSFLYCSFFPFYQSIDGMRLDFLYLGIDVFRSATALGDAPVNVLRGVFNVTGLAMDAIDGIDLKAFLSRV